MIKPALVQLATIQQDLIDKPYLEKNYQVKEVSGYQETLEKVSLLGKLTYSLHMTTQWLNITTDQLYKYDNKIRCGRNADTTKFKYLVNVFNRYYVNDLQPYVSFLDRQYQLVDKQLVVFEPHHLSDTLPDVIYPLAQYYSMFKTANQNHVRYWAQLFKRCNTSVQTILKQ
jgi:hypothetical protein